MLHICNVNSNKTTARIMWTLIHTTTSHTSLQALVPQINDVTGMQLWSLSPGVQKTGHGFRLDTQKTFRPDGRVTWQTNIYICINKQHNA